MKLTLKELEAIIRDAYENGSISAQMADRPRDLVCWRAQYVRDAMDAAKEKSGRKHGK